jgi:hypothetical protein
VLGAGEGGPILWFRNNGTGGFAAMPDVSFANTTGAWSVYAVDLDKDGDLDVLGASSNARTISWVRNDGNGSFTAMPFISTTLFGARFVRAADLNSDGWVDVVCLSEHRSQVVWFQNDGQGGFGPEAVVGTPRGPVEVHTADLDGDGDVDVLSANAAEGSFTWFENKAGLA